MPFFQSATVVPPLQWHFSVELFSPEFSPEQEKLRAVLALDVTRYKKHALLEPTGGLLSLEPDTPDWFAWLATLCAFRFVGKQGRLTAHRTIRNHTYNLRLGSTQSLMIAALEQAAADLQAHLK